jgi:GMP synthase-like glutamine amidotransferase
VTPPTTALILQHQDDAPGGLAIDALKSRAMPHRVVRLDRGDALPDPETVAMAIVLGSEASANDGHEWIATELDWLRAADRAQTPVLGVCFGAQSLALALGGGVGRARRPERGWVRVTTTEPALIGPGPWLTWHDDEITLPAGAQLLAHNDSGVQAFRLRRHLGVQFHPEVTPRIVAAWAHDSRDEDLDVQALMDETSRESGRAAVDAVALFTGFIDGARRYTASRLSGPLGIQPR